MKRETTAPEPQLEGTPTTMGRWSRIVLAAVVVLINLPLLHFYVFRGQQRVSKTVPFSDDFNRNALGDGYWSSGGHWRIVNGQLLSPGVKNNPLWLEATLPADVVVEFDVRNDTPGGDIRAEIFGDGRDHGSGYVLIFGGNAGTLARLDETSAAPPTDSADARWRVQAAGANPQPGRNYRWRIERRGKTLTWFIDGAEYLRMDDPHPLSGKGHDRFGFSSWEGQLFFDNLSIRAADGSTASAPPAPKPTPAAGPFQDDFNREQLGNAWNVTGADSVTLSNGALHLRNAHNRPTWLAQPIPQNATIEFDATADSVTGDIKVEAWGDGRSFYAGDLRLQYTATGYVFILGGWKNSASTIARHSEHLPDQPMRRDFRVEANRTYRWKIQREGARISWFIDGSPFLEFVDPQPLSGPANSYFGFSGWEAPTHFDNLVIRQG